MSFAPKDELAKRREARNARLVDGIELESTTYVESWETDRVNLLMIFNATQRKVTSRIRAQVSYENTTSVDFTEQVRRIILTTETGKQLQETETPRESHIPPVCDPHMGVAYFEPTEYEDITKKVTAEAIKLAEARGAPAPVTNGNVTEDDNEAAGPSIDLEDLTPSGHFRVPLVVCASFDPAG